MSTNNYRSYIKGVRDACRELGDPVPNGYEEGDSPLVSEEGLDLREYLRGQVVAIIDHIKRANRAH